jgi:hypothetical protein
LQQSNDTRVKDRFVADKYTSKMALVVTALPGNLAELLHGCIAGTVIDRVAPVAGSDGEACEVAWGGRMQRAVVRVLHEDGQALIRTEAYIGQDGFPAGFHRQAQLLEAIATHVDGVVAVRDMGAFAVHDRDWLQRVAAGHFGVSDALVTAVEGTGVRWAFTHGAARFGVPDLELYGLTRDEVEPACAALEHVHQQLITRGIGAALTLPSGVPVYLVPVRDAWMKLSLDWPGIGRAGQVRGVGLDGPRATLSVLHPKRFGRYRQDFAGVRQSLGAR